MASNLLTALQKIENGRKGIIKTLKNLNYPISEEASFNKINDILKTNNIEGAPYKNYYVDLGKAHGVLPKNDYVDYYSNPFEDPSIFKKPTNIPDVESILYNAPTIQYNNTSTICYPARMILIDDALAKIYIATSSMIGTSIGSTSMRFGYGTGWSVVTSDGAQYDMTANNLSYGHT